MTIDMRVGIKTRTPYLEADEPLVMYHPVSAEWVTVPDFGDVARYGLSHQDANNIAQVLARNGTECYIVSFADLRAAGYRVS